MKKQYSFLQQYCKKTKGVGRRYPLLAVDVENDPKTGAFICAGVFGERKRKIKGYKNIARVEEFFDSEETFCNYLASLKKNSCLLVFFNLNYDKVFLNPVIDHNSVITNSGRIISCELKNNKIPLFDMANHVDGSLADWINHLDMEREYGITKKSLDDLKERVMNDVKATFYLANFIQDFYHEKCRVPLKYTISSNALLLFRKYFFKDYWTRKHDIRQELEQQAYYGGRTECFKRGTFDCYEYDINSAYLSIMRDNVFPDMRTSHYIQGGQTWRKYWERGYQMIMRCKVHVPCQYIPVLPFRINGKLCFPWGTFTGVWTNVELAEAMKHGTEIIECYDFVYYRHSKPYFKDFAEYVWEKRKEYKEQKNKGMDLMIKKIGNSLYGKFAQKNEKDEYFGYLDEFDGVLPNECLIAKDGNGREYLTIKGKPEPSSHYFPAIAAFITSFCRLKLLKGIKANEKSVIYCDTDSIKVTEPAKGIWVTKELGGWTYEGNCECVSFYKPKMYGKKRKGVPKRAKLIYEDEKEEHYEFEKPLREREAVRRKDIPNKWIKVHKVLLKDDDKREWDENTSLPLLVEEDFKRTLKHCDSCGVVTYDWEIMRTPEWKYRKASGWIGNRFVERTPKRTAGRIIESILCKECYDRVLEVKSGIKRN